MSERRRRRDGPAGGHERTGTAPEPEPEPGGEVVMELNDVTRQFGTEAAVEELSLSVREGELLTLLGPSGCGKTTTLRLLAGLERPDAGEIRLRGRPVAWADGFVQPDDRDVGLIFQDFALFPHLSVGENVAYGLQDRSAEARDERVTELLELVDLSDHREHAPDSLSGGQRQRVALARSLAPEPDVLLLDEPFSNLDVGLRREMREEVRTILKTAGVTAVSVTHDQEEALSMSDRVAVVSDGRIEQVGPPERVFQTPDSRFVAEFLGEAGFLSGRATVDGRVETALGPVGPELLADGGPDRAGAAVDVLVRPDDLHATPAGAARTGEDGGESRRSRPSDGSSGVAGQGDADGRIVHRQYTGPSFVYRVELASGDVVHCQHNHVDRLAVGRSVAVELTADHELAWFPAE